jgi:Ca2+/Na+ antiporter
MSGSIFVSVSDMPWSWNGWIQLLFIGFIYTYLVINGCMLIGEGSELLELTKYGPLVGPTILPVLGAVPDGAIVLFSGIGSDAQSQLETGVGALAGSTVMLLTVPWILCVIGGRVNLDENGVGTYKSKPKLNPPDNMDIFTTGISLNAKGHEVVWTMGVWMLVTALSFLVVQIPTFVYLSIDDDDRLASLESAYVLTGFIMATLFFVAYLIWSYLDAMGDDDEKTAIKDVKKADAIAQSLSKGTTTLAGAVWELVKDVPLPSAWQLQNNGNKKQQTGNSDYGSGGDTTTSIEQSLESIDLSVIKANGNKYTKLRDAVRPFFNKYAGEDGTIDVLELQTVFFEMGERKSAAELQALFKAFDKDHNGAIDLDEFSDGCAKYVLLRQTGAVTSGTTTSTPIAAVSAAGEQSNLEVGGADDDDDGDDEEEMPAEFEAIKDPAEQQKAIIKKAGGMLALGTGLVLIFSDPLVDVLDEIGDRTGISAFYLAFVLAPLITNGSELFASYTFAKKKTTSSITCSLQQLFGAAIMNNTFCLLVFYALIYFQDLYWAFSAETMAILFVEVAMMYFAYKSTHRIFDAILVASLYPLCLLLVFFLENVVGLD